MEWEWEIKFKIGIFALLRKRDHFDGDKWAIGIKRDLLGEGRKSWSATDLRWGTVK